MRTVERALDILERNCQEIPLRDLPEGEDAFLVEAARLASDFVAELDSVMDVLQFGQILAELSRFIGKNYTYNGGQ